MGEGEFGRSYSAAEVEGIRRYLEGRADAAEQRVRELEAELGEVRQAAGAAPLVPAFASSAQFKDVSEATERAHQAEAKLATAVEALRRVDNGVPSEEHWHRMGDAMWANIGRQAAEVVRAALAEIEGEGA
jgi:hypothetical protein